MPKIKLVVSDAPATLTTYGSLWKFPRAAGDKPVIDLVTVRGVANTLDLPTGRYQYYFTFTGQQDDDEFTLTMKYAAAQAPAPTSTPFRTVPAGSRVFRFLV